MSEHKSKNIVWNFRRVTKQGRINLMKQKGLVIWLTGLPRSGKSTIAIELESVLFSNGYLAYVLDGDNIRHGLNKDLGFSPTDRTENIRRIGEVAKLFSDANIITITAFISPHRADRDMVRSLHKEGEFVEVYVKCPLFICETRDMRGIYKKARAGEIPEFTGISSPYEEPVNPEIILDTSTLSVEESVRVILSYLKERGYIRF